ncbi:helix-turn-helix domain-containing protein, partial [Gilliamella apicola]|uniref:helix-turn-helix domain-containing protein n=1 Tax=Gilliamella sp. GillExp13 TaxID=3120243 RepID=UPI001146654E
MAQLLNRHPSTISREIKRNSKPNQAYQAHDAVTLARKRRKNSGNGKPIESSVWRQVEKSLMLYYSPEQIAARIKEGDRRYKRSIKQRPSYVESRKTRGHW